MGRERAQSPAEVSTGFLFPLEALLGIVGEAKTFSGGGGGKTFDSPVICQACQSFVRRP